MQGCKFFICSANMDHKMVSHEEWCKRQLCSRLPCVNREACLKGFFGALSEVVHDMERDESMFVRLRPIKDSKFIMDDFVKQGAIHAAG